MKLKTILYLIFFIAAVGYLGWAIFFFPKKARNVPYRHTVVNLINSNDSSFVSKSDVLQQLQSLLKLKKGELCRNINTYLIEKTLNKSQMYSDAEAFTTMQGDLIIKVRLKEPLFLVLSNEGKKTYWITHRGEIMPFDSKYTIPLLVASGNISSDYAKTTLYNFIKILKEDPYWRTIFTQVYVDKNGGITLIPVINKMEIYLGKEPSWRTKLTRLKIFFKKIVPEAGWNRFHHINLDYKGQIIAS